MRSAIGSMEIDCTFENRSGINEKVAPAVAGARMNVVKAADLALILAPIG